MELITKNDLDVILKDETLSKLLFKEKEFPVGFKIGICDAVDIANRTYRNTSSIIGTIVELTEHLGTFRNKNIEYGYYFILSYLHFLMNDKALALMAIACITNSYKSEDNVNDWDNVVMSE